MFLGTINKETTTLFWRARGVARVSVLSGLFGAKKENFGGVLKNGKIDKFCLNVHYTIKNI